MESIEIVKFMYLDISTAIPDLINAFGIAFVGGITIAILLHLASAAVFGLIGLLDIKDK